MCVGGCTCSVGLHVWGGDVCVFEFVCTVHGALVEDSVSSL